MHRSAGVTLAPPPGSDPGPQFRRQSPIRSALKSSPCLARSAGFPSADPRCWPPGGAL